MAEFSGIHPDTSGLVKFVIAIKNFIVHFIKILNYIGKVDCLDP